MVDRAPRREHPAPLPGIAEVRIVGDDQAVRAAPDALRAACTDSPSDSIWR
ncbi:hypothetical protein AB0K74_29755 [Streptomyces sp. NPDC056159]|uniref:hypothetical protein n=1 Tax=unclassified Streptomyces TaxID=2593676 RepID=UPI003445D4DF